MRFGTSLHSPFETRDVWRTEFFHSRPGLTHPNNTTPQQITLTKPLPVWDIPIMAQSVTVAKHDKRKRLVLPDDFVAEAPYGESLLSGY